MSKLDSTITVSKELRPCFVQGEKALFHIWLENNINNTVGLNLGLVEFEDGKMRSVKYDKIIFCDTWNKMYDLESCYHRYKEREENSTNNKNDETI